MRKSLVVLWCLVFLSTYADLTSANLDKHKPPGFRRFMIVVGSNDGGLDRVPLRYSHADAREVVKVFLELGGVGTQDYVLLVDPNRDGLLEALEDLEERVSETNSVPSRVECIFYYSGHSDGHGLLDDQ